LSIKVIGPYLIFNRIIGNEIVGAEDEDLYTIRYFNGRFTARRIVSLESALA
jgi:hypothetical protein